MLKLSVAIVLIATLVPGSADAKNRPSLRESLAVLKGKPVEAAVHILGLPTSKMDMAGSTIFTWRKDNVFSGYGADERPLSCEIRIGVSSAGLIERSNFDGNRGACELFEKQFSQHAS